MQQYVFEKKKEMQEQEQISVVVQQATQYFNTFALVWLLLLF